MRDMHVKQISSKKENEPNLLTFIVFSVSGDSLSDTTSSVGANTLNPTDKVSRWLWHTRNNAPSSGYDTMSITSSSQHSKMERNIDNIPMVQNHPSDVDTPKYARNMRGENRARSFSM